MAMALSGRMRLMKVVGFKQGFEMVSRDADSGSEVGRGILIGLVSGLAAISCCVSPVVFALLGIATAAEAVALGDTLYYTYGWGFRAAGIAVAATAVVLFLRQRRQCDIRGTRRHWRMLAALAAAGAAAYAGLFWLTKYLGIWFA